MPTDYLYDIKEPCGCKLDRYNVLHPCKSHWQLLHDEFDSIPKTDGKLNKELSEKLGVSVYEP